MIAADQVERRLDFALNSPDFWRGLIIALAALTVMMLVRVILLTLKTKGPRPPTGAKWTQISGLLSYGLLVATSAGAAFDRLGNVSFSWRLITSATGVILGIGWVYGTLNIHPRWLRRKRKTHDE